jgi:hypothetical protein
MFVLLAIKAASAQEAAFFDGYLRLQGNQSQSVPPILISAFFALSSFSA